MISNLPTKHDLIQLLTDIKHAKHNETEIIKTELTAISTRLLNLESRQTAVDTNLNRQGAALLTHARQTFLLRRGFEDAENRSRRHNIRIRGIPEDLQTAEDKNTDIPIDRFHRVARGRSGKPRDILCCLHNYTTKDQILSKARDIKNMKIEEDNIELFQDLAPSTVNQRWLKEVTSRLRDRNIPYKWGFPFSLIARHSGNSQLLREPEECENVFRSLGIPPVYLSEWARYVYGLQLQDQQDQQEDQPSES
ncbi:hypothetical protein XELAEV_18000635mg [Xenopus laevis]|nr:hypothetical protein XELAEV_18000635mg [Xenopus laevis]